MKQGRHYCVNIRFSLRLVATLHVLTLFLGHLQAFKNDQYGYSPTRAETSKKLWRLHEEEKWKEGGLPAAAN